MLLSIVEIYYLRCVRLLPHSKTVSGSHLGPFFVDFERYPCACVDYSFFPQLKNMFVRLIVVGDLYRV